MDLRLQHLIASSASGLFAAFLLFSGLGVMQTIAQNAIPINVQITSPQNGATFKSSQPINISAFVFVSGQHKEGDTIRFAFFANTNQIGSATSQWHPAQRPPVRPGQAVPQYIIAPGFSSVKFQWTNAQPGSYALTAKASFQTNTAVSKAVDITVDSK